MALVGTPQECVLNFDQSADGRFSRQHRESPHLVSSLRSRCGQLGAALAGLAGAALFASPAAADPPAPVTITTQADCDHATGVESVVYTVTNVSSGTVHLHTRFFGPNGGHIPDNGDRDLASGQTTVYHETVDPVSVQAVLGLNVTVAGSGETQEVKSDQMFFSCAEAHVTTISGVAKCDAATGITTVSWTTATDDRLFSDADPLRFDLVSFQPSAILASVQDPHTVTTVRTGEAAHFVEKIAPGHGTARLTLRVRLSVRHAEDQPTDVTSANVDYHCAAPSPSPSATVFPGPSSSTPVGAPAGVGSPNLPVTGTPVTSFAAAGSGLLGIGGALFVIARRRRIKFKS